MEVYVRKRRSGPPLEVIAALVLGIAVGFAICYAMYGGKAPNPAPPEQVATTSQPEQPVTPPQEEPQPTEPATPETPAPAPTDQPPAPPAPEPASAVAAVEDVWPARHLFIAIKGQKLDNQTKELLAELKPGGVVLRLDNIKDKTQTVALVQEIKTAVGLGTTIDSLPLVAIAQEGTPSNVLRLKDAPTAAKLGGAKDLNAATEAGTSVGKSCADRSIGVLFAPVLDVYAKGGTKDMQARSFGENYQEVAAIGLAFADGVVKAGVLPVVKHFPGLGTVKEDTQKTLATLNDDPERLSQLIYPFSEAARCNVPGILVGHVAVPKLDTDVTPTPPASMSVKFLKGLLREKFGYPGVILADDLAKGAVTKAMPLEKAAVTALANGCDAVLMLDSDLEKIRLVCATIEQAATEGALDRAQLSDSKKRLDAWQQALKTPKTALDGPLPQLPGAAPAIAAGEPNPAAPAAAETPAAPTSEIEYTVEKGDSLKKIANKFDVSPSDIKEWNKLSSDNLFAGRKLVIKTSKPTAGAETKPADTKPADAKPAEPAPADAKPAEPAPAADAAKPVEPAPAEGSTTEPPSEEPSVQPPANSKTVQHVVKNGEFLASIATKYGVQFQDVMTWNHMNDTKLSVGQSLTIYVPQDFVVPADAADAPKKDEKPATDTSDKPKDPAPAADTTKTDTPAAGAAAPAAEGTEITYTVQKGDNVANIASKYGVTVDDVKTWNELTSNRIDVGQKLKIRPKKMPAQ